jgi:hypothetical protein
MNLGVILETLEGADRAFRERFAAHSEVQRRARAKHAARERQKKMQANLRKDGLGDPAAKITWYQRWMGAAGSKLMYRNVDPFRERDGRGGYEMDPEEAQMDDLPGLPVTVYTVTGGLTVRYTCAYHFDPHPVFGAPTSPVFNRLGPGIYKFGVCKPGENQPMMDDGEYAVEDFIEVNLPF